MRKWIYPLFILLVITMGIIPACQKRNESDRSKAAGPHTILRHSTALYTSIAFFVGTQIDIFTFLDKQPLSIKEASAVTNIKPVLLERLLYALVASEMLTVENGIFANTEEASRYLVKGKPDYLGNHVLVNPLLKYWMIHAGTITAETFRKGTAVEKFDYSGSSYEDLLDVFRGTMPIAVEAGEELAKAFDFAEYATVADVGGASGGLAASLVKAFPHLKATVTDLPSVTPVAQTLLQEQGMPEIDVMDWDVSHPSQKSFDVVVLRALIQVLSPDFAKQALINIGKSVNPGGKIYILGHIMDDSRISPPEEVIWYLFNLNWDDHAGFYAEEDFREMLQKAGFEDIRRDYLSNGDGVMIASKPKS
jgi:hypothetical protein